MSSPEDLRPHKVMATMAVGFLLLSAVFAVMGIADVLDGRFDSRAGSSLRSEDAAFFWKQVRTTFLFSGFTLLTAGGCLAASVIIRRSAK